MGKNQKIKYNTRGDAFITYYGRRYYLHNIYKGEDGRGYISLSNFGGLIVELGEDGETAKVSTCFD